MQAASVLPSPVAHSDTVVGVVPMRQSSASVLFRGELVAHNRVPSHSHDILDFLEGLGDRPTSIVIQFPWLSERVMTGNSEIRRIQLISETAMRWVSGIEIFGKKHGQPIELVRTWRLRWTAELERAGKVSRNAEGRIADRVVAERLGIRLSADEAQNFTTSSCLAKWYWMILSGELSPDPQSLTVVDCSGGE